MCHLSRGSQLAGIHEARKAALAKEFARTGTWNYVGNHAAGVLKAGKTFSVAAKQFLKEYQVLTEGQRSPKWVLHLEHTLNRHLLPYFGSMVVSEITPGKAKEYRIHRAQNGYRGIPPARNTIAIEIVGIRHVLKTAKRHGWLEHVPDLSPPFKASRKISHRAWFSPQEYRLLYEATREREESQERELALESSNSTTTYCLWPTQGFDRMKRRDWNIVTSRSRTRHVHRRDHSGNRSARKTWRRSLQKHLCAVRPYFRLRERNNPQPTDQVSSNT